jgi:hypothetical protein
MNSSVEGNRWPKEIYMGLFIEQIFSTVSKESDPKEPNRPPSGEQYPLKTRPSLPGVPRSYSNGGTVLNQETMESISV